MITQDELKDRLHYEPETGVFTWLKTKNGSTRPGDVAGTLKFGYISICIEKKIYQAHRLVWLYIHGSWPEKHLDHMNNIRSDNRICNLRECSDVQNSQNRSKQSNNSSGYKGVLWHKRDQKWQARAMINGKQYHIGQFDDPKKASEAYQKFCQENYKDFYKNTE